MQEELTRYSTTRNGHARAVGKQAYGCGTNSPRTFLKTGLVALIPYHLSQFLRCRLPGTHTCVDRSINMPRKMTISHNTFLLIKMPPRRNDKYNTVIYVIYMLF